MALTESSMLPLGTKAPNFELIDTISGTLISLNALKTDKATVIMFICNHCPYVIHLLESLVELAKTYKAKGVQFVAISANDVSAYPADSPENMKQLAVEKGFTFPYLYDESQATAKAYHAECTPDFFVFNDQLRLEYRGRFDESTPGKPTVPITGGDLRTALDAVLAKKPVTAKQLPSMGCNIKWKD